MADERELAPGEWSVLGLLAEQPAHGWALAAELAPDGGIGSVWSLGRPLVYRSLEILERRGLIEPAGLEDSVRGP
jgi:PadR family transcriptional regulator AphA